MNKLTQLSLINFFDQIRKGESAQNKIKMKLSLYHPLSHIQSIFNKISKNSELITPSLLKEYMNQALQVSQNDVYCVFKKFDRELKGVVDLKDFKKQLDVIQIDSRNFTDGTGKVSDIEELIIELFKSYLGYQDLINVCRRQLKSQLFYEMFDEIARQRKGYISRTELIHFYQYNDRKLKESSCTFLVHGLNRRSYSKITLEAFCESLHPLQLGYYQQYQNLIDQHDRLMCEYQEQEEMKIARHNKKIEDRINQLNAKNERIEQAQRDRQRITEQLTKLKRLADEQKEQRKILERTLKKEQSIRHNLSSQIESYKKQFQQSYYDQSRVRRLEDIRNQELAESRQLSSRIFDQQQYLNSLKEKIYLEKSDLLDRSECNGSRIAILRNQDRKVLKQLQIQQQSLYNKLVSPISQKYYVDRPKQVLEMKDLGKIYKSTDNLTNSRLSYSPNYDSYSYLGKNSLGSTKQQLRSWKQYETQISPKYSASYLHRY